MAQAEELIREGIEIKAGLYETDHLTHATPRQALAEVLEMQGRSEEALEMYELGLAILTTNPKALEEDHAEIREGMRLIQEAAPEP